MWSRLCNGAQVNGPANAYTEDSPLERHGQRGGYTNRETASQLEEDRALGEQRSALESTTRSRKEAAGRRYEREVSAKAAKMNSRVRARSGSRGRQRCARCCQWPSLCSRTGQRA